ncbi:MAG TPA: TRAP transporter substrate-binding protein [Burkholderiales bacterium]|jgi:TRAP-type mannitol/chloroaromatic compound transport system substrate-binding protein|nr:TRAP transporter substrate-binding protein [Burkholderiales bacterium]
MHNAGRRIFALTMLAAALGFAAPAVAQKPAAGPRVLKMQSSWPASLTLQDNFRFFAERVDKLTGGQLKIDALAAGQVVPAFEVLDATNKKVIDGAHSVSYYWVGKSKTATLFASTPAGPFGMDTMDFMGWLYEGGGLDLWWEFYQKELKLNVVVFPILPAGPQAFGWFKRPIKNLADFKGMKCRQTGIVAEIFQKMGMQTVNMPGGEIVPSAQRGVIDCAEWVGGVEDLRLGLPQVWKYHYVPGMHESSIVGELLINADVWKSLPPQQQEAIRSATTETFTRWWVKWQRQNADAIEEMRTKYGTQILRTPPEILVAFLKAWDEIAKEESAKNPFFKKVLDSQRTYAAKVVPAKRFMFPPYSFAANYYWPEKKPAAKGDSRKK